VLERQIAFREPLVPEERHAAISVDTLGQDQSPAWQALQRRLSRSRIEVSRG